MKNRIYTIFILTLIIFLSIGCKDDFLDVQPKEATSLDNFLTSKSDAVAAINSAYSSLQPSWLFAYPKLIAAPSDDFKLDNTFHYSLVSYSWSSTLGPLSSHWDQSYQGILRANLVLQKVPNVKNMDQSLKDRIVGEAYFLRGLNYLRLMTIFGEVPLVTEANPKDASAAELPKSPIPDVIDQIVSDLKDAIDLLPPEYDDNNIGRATEGAAKAYLGKTYLYSASPIFGGDKEGYKLAVTQFKDVINNYNYHLVHYKDLWVKDNNPEQIFEIQYGAYGSSRTGPQNERQYRGFLHYPVGHGGNGNYNPTQDLVDEFESYSGPDAEDNFDGRDPRLYYNVWKQGDYFDDIEPEYQSSWSPTGYNLKKGLAFPFDDRAEDGMTRNVPLIRLGDVLLMYAEAVNAKSSREPQVAVTAINRIRDRVNMPIYPDTESPYSVDGSSSSKQEIFKAIVHERRVELVGEYQRYNDLRRWELAEKELGPLGWEYPKHIFFPLPAEEVEVNDQLEQNPNY